MELRRLGLWEGLDGLRRWVEVGGHRGVNVESNITHDFHDPYYGTLLSNFDVTC
jgi:hypothetical protein